MLYNRKGNVLGIFTLISIIFAFIIGGIYALKILTQFEASTNTILTGTSNDVLQSGGDVFGLMDLIIPILVVVLGLVFILSALYIRTNPAYFFISLFIIIIVIIGVAPLSNVISAIDQTSQFENETATFSKSVAVGENFPVIGLVFGAGFLLVLYGLWSGRI